MELDLSRNILDREEDLASHGAVSQDGAGRRPTLTPTERRVLTSLSIYRADKAIARDLKMSLYAVRFHLKGIYKKLDVHNRRAAVVAGLDHHLIDAAA